MDYLSRQLWNLSAKQDGVLSRRQLLQGRLTEKAIAHRLSTGRLWPMLYEVYAVGRPQVPREGKWRAALLALGEDAALSHLTAAAVWRLVDEPRAALVDVSVPTRSGRGRRDGIRVHRCGTLVEADVGEYRGFRVTSLERTHIDLTLVLSAKRQRALLREAEYRHRLDLGELRRRVDGGGRSNKHGRMRRLLDEWVPGVGLTESELEAAFLELCVSSGLEIPEPQRRLLSYRVDFLWRGPRLVVEVDGYEAHRGRIAFQRDRAKDRRLKAAGYDVLRFTWAEVVGKQVMVRRELQAAHARRARELRR